MAISDKEAARQIIDGLPDDVTLEDIVYAMYVRQQVERGLRDADAGNLIDHEIVKREIEEQLSVPRRLVQKGHVTALEPIVPVPQITIDIVNDLIEEMRRWSRISDDRC